MGIVTGLWVKEAQLINNAAQKVIGKPVFKDALMAKAKQFDEKYGKKIDAVYGTAVGIAVGGPAVGKIIATAKSKAASTGQVLQAQALQKLESKGLPTSTQTASGNVSFPKLSLPEIKVPESIIKKSEELLKNNAQKTSEAETKSNNTMLIAAAAALMFLL